MIRVAVVDDHLHVAIALRALLDKTPIFDWQPCHGAAATWR